MGTGKFYGVGLGPGDPGLVTLRAAEVLRSVDLIFSVASRQSDRSVSGRILDALPGVVAGRVELEFTMSKDFGERLRRIEEHAEKILVGLRTGSDVAFVTIGDPMTYSTCGYLLRALRRMEPALRFEIIPGVNSWSALAAATASPLVEDREVLQILPTAVAPDDETIGALQTLKGTTVLLKCYRTRDELIRKLRGCRRRVTYGANLGLEDAFISEDPAAIADRPEEYLSMLMVRRTGKRHS